MASSTRSNQEQAIYDRFAYSGTHVLRNKLNITDHALLEKAEADLVTFRELNPEFPTQWSILRLFCTCWKR